MQKQVNSLLQKEMTRKEFMATLGFGMASVMGFSTIIRMLSGKPLSHHKSLSGGYGSNPYGR
jgi:hypothetical protein